jgi:hypothetical protein
MNSNVSDAAKSFKDLERSSLVAIEQAMRVLSQRDSVIDAALALPLPANATPQLIAEHANVRQQIMSAREETKNKLSVLMETTSQSEAHAAVKKLETVKRKPIGFA